MPLTGLKFDRSVLLTLFKECTPRILVYTDGLNHDDTAQFGLAEFTNTLKAAKVHGMAPIVTRAHRSTDASADLQNYRFDDPTNGVTISRYDVVFMLCIGSGAPSLPPTERDALAVFMQAGGGLFATGDHSTLGAADCGDLLRVRAMRRWDSADTPPGMGDATRHSTNRSGTDETEEFGDQEDSEPQVLYPNFRTTAGGLGNPHPLLQLVAPRKVLEVYPDHPHEGECVLPSATALAASYTVAGKKVAEWPDEPGVGQVVPELVAYTVSYGDGFPPKEPLTPKLLGAICAYDGHRADVGRVVTDATWHHFVNVNLIGSVGGTGALKPGGVDSEALVRIKQHYVNLATWLMPEKVRRCLRWPFILQKVFEVPLYEELQEWPPRPGPDPGPEALGRLVLPALRAGVPAFVVEELVDDLVDDGAERRTAKRLRAVAGSRRGLTEHRVGLAALGAAVATVVQAFSDPRETITPHQTFEAKVPGAVGRAIREAALADVNATRERLELAQQLVERAKKE